MPGGSGDIDSINNNILFNIKNISNTLMLLADEKEIQDYKDLEYDAEMAMILRNSFKKWFR